MRHVKTKKNHHKRHAQAENDQANIQYELWVVDMRDQPLEQLPVVQILVMPEHHWVEYMYGQWIKSWYLDLDEDSYKADAANSSCTFGGEIMIALKLEWKPNVW